MSAFVKLNFLATLVALALLAGCGGSGDGTGTSPASTSSPGEASTSQAAASEPVTKAEFIKQADAICAKADEKQNKALEAKLGPKSTQSEEEAAVTEYGLPPIQEEADELKALEVPAGDEGEIDAIINGIEVAVGKAEINPASVITGTGPFQSVEKLASAYGFKTCNTPA